MIPKDFKLLQLQKLRYFHIVRQNKILIRFYTLISIFNIEKFIDTHIHMYT